MGFGVWGLGFGVWGVHLARPREVLDPPTSHTLDFTGRTGVVVISILVDVMAPAILLFFSSALLSSLELSATKVYEP